MLNLNTTHKILMPNCSVPECPNSATVEVLLYDVYLHPDGGVFSEQDRTCPFLCENHMIENEERAEGERRPRGDTRYPYTNQNGAQGFTIYRELGEAAAQEVSE